MTKPGDNTSEREALAARLEAALEQLEAALADVPDEELERWRQEITDEVDERIRQRAAHRKAGKEGRHAPLSARVVCSSR